MASCYIVSDVQLKRRGKKNSAFSITVFTLNCELMIPGANGSTSDQREGTNPYKPLNYPTNTPPPLPCCVSIKQMFRLKSVSAFGVRPIEIRQLVLNGNVAGKLITDWWSRNVLQLQAIDYRLEDNSIFNPRLQLISSIYPPRPHISLWSTQSQIHIDWIALALRFHAW